MKLGRPALNVVTIGTTAALCLTLPVSTLRAQAQTTQQPPTTPAPPPPPDNLDRIREAVSRPSRLRVENGQLRIYVDVIGKWPNFAELTKGYDLLNGPTSTTNNAMSHQEFLGMVTPKEMAGSGGVSVGEILTMAVVNYVGQKVVKMGIEKIGKAKSEKEIRDIRAQIDRELAALRGGK